MNLCLLSKILFHFKFRPNPDPSANKTRARWFRIKRNIFRHREKFSAYHPPTGGFFPWATTQKFFFPFTGKIHSLVIQTAKRNSLKLHLNAEWLAIKRIYIKDCSSSQKPTFRSNHNWKLQRCFYILRNSLDRLLILPFLTICALLGSYLYTWNNMSYVWACYLIELKF